MEQDQRYMKSAKSLTIQGNIWGDQVDNKELG